MKKIIFICLCIITLPVFSQTSKTSDVDKLLDYLFNRSLPQVADNTLEKRKTEMAEYAQKGNELLAMGADKYSSKAEMYKKYLGRTSGYVDPLVEKHENWLKENNVDAQIECNHLEVEFNQLFWDIARKVFPSESLYESNFQKMTALYSKMGSIDNMKSSANKNNEDVIKNRKMEVPVTTDENLEKFVMDEFNIKYKNEYGTSLKVVLLQNGWTIERHTVSGVVTGRNRATQIAYKGSDGKCYLLAGILYIYEEYDGSSYTNRTVVYNGLGGQEMSCENVK